MYKILTIILVVLFSSNVFAEVSEKDYIDQGKKVGSKVNVSKFYWSDGKYVYNLHNMGKGIFNGAVEAKAGEICGKKGYILLREETHSPNRRQIIKCNK
jgi:hypothetical protein